MSNTANEVVEKIDEEIKVGVPSMYKVLLHNDDKTTFEFVVAVLRQIYHKTTEEAIEITEAVHVVGRGVAGGPYTLEIAEEKVQETAGFARANNFPLVSSFEEV